MNKDSEAILQKNLPILLQDLKIRQSCLLIMRPLQVRRVHFLKRNVQTENSTVRTFLSQFRNCLIKFNEINLAQTAFSKMLCNKIHFLRNRYIIIGQISVTSLCIGNAQLITGSLKAAFNLFNNRIDGAFKIYEDKAPTELTI